jgi:FAD dependent monooxygenase
MRIFDQFGILEKIHATTTPVSAAYQRWPNGSVHSHSGTVKKIDELYVQSLAVLRVWKEC